MQSGGDLVTRYFAPLSKIGVDLLTVKAKKTCELFIFSVLQVDRISCYLNHDPCESRDLLRRIVCVQPLNSLNLLEKPTSRSH